MKLESFGFFRTDSKKPTIVLIFPQNSGYFGTMVGFFKDSWTLSNYVVKVQPDPCYNRYCKPGFLKAHQ
jgi:hypothetical protein